MDALGDLFLGWAFAFVFSSMVGLGLDVDLRCCCSGCPGSVRLFDGERVLERLLRVKPRPNSHSDCSSSEENQRWAGASITRSTCNSSSRLRKNRTKDKSQQTLLDLTKVKGVLSKSAKKETTIFIARTIARDLQPYEFVEKNRFQNFIRHLQPQYKIPHRTTFSRTVIPELYRRTVDSLKKQIASDIANGLESLAFTTDMWTSRENQGYISLTCHYMTQDFAVKAFTLACCHLQESHTAVNIQAYLTEIVKEWSLDLSNVPVYVVTDNGRNIRSAMRQME
ncbi:hypothetical protein HPB49_011842 [Dermacentor silvarum]|uniref:Uncharacterized protein n=1 Tax=Dermacentor silvarum TaxID=543639 RepID=A0ACB8DZM9_DERSI|nr:hypothetical protein HPB49_011842 [Dermacentor silvarum]